MLSKGSNCLRTVLLGMDIGSIFVQEILELRDRYFFHPDYEDAPESED